MKRKHILIGFLLGLGICAPLLQADDTEIYTNAGGGAGSNVPSVMLNLDIRPNVGSTICSGETDCRNYLGNELYNALDPQTQTRLASRSNEKLNLQELFVVVLRRVMQKLIDDGFALKVGVMVNHRDGNNCEPGDTQCSNGAYVLEGLKPLTQAYADQIKNKLQYVINTDQSDSDFSASDHKFQGKELYFELFRYLTGQGIYNGHLAWTDYDKNANSDKNDNLDEDWPTLVWDSSVENGNNYVSPLDPNDPCGKIYAINVLHQVSQQEDGSDNAISASKASGGTGSARNTFPDMIRFMHDADLGSIDFNAPNVEGDQGVISYFLSQNVNTTTNGYAAAGGTGTARDLDLPPAQLVEDITNIFLEILSVSTTFVAASIPVNAFNRATVTNNVYFALFQAKTGPVWPGNLKRLRLTSTQVFVDANGDNAIAPDGRIKNDALTFWTNPAGLDVQAADADEGEVPGKDGRSVERGGSGQQIPGFLSADPSVRGDPGDNNSDSGARQLFTEPGSYTNGAPGTALQPFNADDSSLAASLQASLGAGSSDEAEKLMRWLRGYAANEPNDQANTSDVKPWFQADALHSRPVPVNYGLRGTGNGAYSGNNQDIRILVGTNNGFFHMFRNTAPGSNGNLLGDEVWAFAPRTALGNTPTLRENATNAGHPYGVDGAATVKIQDLNADGNIKSSDGDTTYAYFGLRRGGKSYYALNISDPDDPKILWSVHSHAGSPTEDLGLSFSQPQVGKVKYGATATPIIAVGGGYDINKDTRPGPGTDDSEGNVIYFLNADSGAVVWSASFAPSPAAPTATEFQHAELKDSIPAEVALIDINSDGLTDRFYFADTAGRLWRGDTPPATTDTRNKWAITLLGDFGRHVTADLANDRRTFHSVDATRGTDASGEYIAVIMGTGDRANPKEVTTNNKLIVIKDRKQFNAATGVISDTSDLPYELSDLADVTDNCLQINPAGCNADLTTDILTGWFLDMEAPGEKILSSPLTVSGTIFFSSYLPQAGAASACLASEGGGRGYAVRLNDGGAAFNLDTSNDGDNDVDETGKGKNDRYEVLNAPGIPPDPVLVPPVDDLDTGPDCSPTGDVDGDGIENSADNDDDGDGVIDADDNCPCESNADQTDSDGDGTGDVCEADNNICGVLVGTQFMPALCPSTNTFWYQIEDPNNPN